MTKDHKKGLIKPGNEKYLSYYKRQDEWKPEKPVGAIGAMSSSPGPAIVNLPPTIGDEGHDPRRQKAPAFSVGKDVPAPNAYTLPKTLGIGDSPYSKGPAFSIADRLDKGLHQSPNPGPAAYKLPPADKTKRRMPAFSMGSQISCSKTGTVTPGPASNYYHMVKFHKPSTPRYTFGIKHSPFKAFERFAAES
ncbi:outer dense fiber protein 3-like protein 1 [Uloborus diversus]|uniref:outer dense fiber protein 3-like protein 1 n=1 Tax=Uloborus diversus TaxID=327109 RepID=UPI002409614D|nr:outer dense fiber protein 3-like protein 1 [Uloborus diversus]